MEIVRLKAHVDDDGILKLEVPIGTPARDIEVVLIVETKPSTEVDANGWPVDFFDQTYGSLADDPLIRPPQLPLEDREPLE
jgi:hypothetical protein